MVNSNICPPLSILIGSFNTYKLLPPSDINLSPWLTHQSHIPHIIAIGLQELPGSWPFLPEKCEDQWMKLFDRTLPKHQLYSRVRLNSNDFFMRLSCILYSLDLILFIYVQSSYINQCSSMSTAAVPTVRMKFLKDFFHHFSFFQGFLNLYGNKGSVGIRFDFQQTSLCFLNCHLSPGENPDDFQRRNDQYSRIHQRMLFHSPCRNHQWKIPDHHGIFLFGDLNYRQTKSNEDELSTKTNILQTYSESKISFPPTYKYHLNSDSYNPLRRSSWTDRILYRVKHCQIRSIDYWTTSMIRFSDHRPVANLFLLSRLLR